MTRPEPFLIAYGNDYRLDDGDALTAAPIRSDGTVDEDARVEVDVYRADDSTSLRSIRLALIAMRANRSKHPLASSLADRISPALAAIEADPGVGRITSLGIGPAGRVLVDVRWETTDPYPAPYASARIGRDDVEAWSDYVLSVEVATVAYSTISARASGTG